MEPAAGKVKRMMPTSLLSRITDICKVHSVGADAPSLREKLKADSTATTGESSDDGTAHTKVHPHQVSDNEFLSESSSARCQEAVVEKLLDGISGLKSAYINLQQAHVPYDPEEIMIADERFASVLDEAAELKDLYVNVDRWGNPIYRCYLSFEIQECQKSVMELQAAICKGDSEIVSLRAELGELQRKNTELDKKIDGNALCTEGRCKLRKGVSTEMLMDLYERSSESIHEFSKFIIGWTTVSGWNLDLSTFTVDKSVVYDKRSDKKYAVEAYFACRMLMGDSEELFSMYGFDRVMNFRDPFDALMDAPNSNFGRFCRSKYLFAVSPGMEDSFFGNLDHRAFVESGGHPRTPFYQEFVRMARYVWALLTAARSSNPRAEMFCVKTGVQFRKEHMESMPSKMTTEEEKMDVGFTVMPGFKIGSTVIKCRVYLSMVNPMGLLNTSYINR